MISSSSIYNENKKSRLLLDYEILSSLKKQKMPEQNANETSETRPQSQSNLSFQNINSQNNISLLSSFNLFNLPSKDNNSDKLLTNNSFYHNDLSNLNSKHISMLSFDNKDFKNTSETFYKNFLPSFQMPNLYHNSKFTQDFSQQKKDFELENNESLQQESHEIPELVKIIWNDNDKDDIIKKKKPNIFIHHKYERRMLQSDSFNHDKCQHPNCDFYSLTKKQKMFHHNKMNNECKNDTINILKLIKEAKEIIGANSGKSHLSNKQKKAIKSIKDRYESVIKCLSLNDYAQFITGLEFNKTNNNSL